MPSSYFEKGFDLFRWPEKDSEINMPYNLRKKPKSLDISSGNNELSQRNRPRMGQEKYTDIPRWRIHTPESLQEYSSHSQDQLKRIFGQRRHRNIELRNVTEESESSEEEDVSEEKLEKTEGWKLLTKAIDSKCECG